MYKLIFCLLLITGFANAAPESAPISEQINLLNKYNDIVDNSPTLVQSLSLEQRKRLLKVVSENSVASLSKISFYDPPQNTQDKGEIGYCYGRAMAAHLLARKMGLAESSIQKIFAAGDMQNGTVRWRFHMSTVVPGDDGELYAIDPIMIGLIARYNIKHGTNLKPEEPLTPKKWIELVKEFYDNTESILEKYPNLSNNSKFTGTIKFYMAESQTIMVDMREVPAHLDVENGERLIEILFQPQDKPGFNPVYLSAEDEELGNISYYTVENHLSLSRYFTLINEPLTEQFNFFNMSVDIFYIKDDVLGKANRFYLYNGKQPQAEEFQDYSQGYFPSLFKSVDDFDGVFQ